MGDASAPFHLLGADMAAALYAAKLQGLLLRGGIFIALHSTHSRLDSGALVGANDSSLSGAYQADAFPLGSLSYFRGSTPPSTSRDRQVRSCA